MSRRSSDGPAGKAGGQVRRRKRAPSLVGGLSEATPAPEFTPARPPAEAAPTDAPAPPREPGADEPALSRAERRRRRLAASDRERALSDRQKEVLGLGEPEPITEDTIVTREEPRPPRAWQRHDLLVVAIAGLLLGGGSYYVRRENAPQLAETERFGLHFARPLGWLAPHPVAPPELHLLPGGAKPAAAPPGQLPYHEELRSTTDPRVRLEIRVERTPAYGNLRTVLALARVARYGEAYGDSTTSDATIDGRDWLRTRYRYAFKLGKNDSPELATAIELATASGDLLYTVTVHGDEADARRLEALIAPTLKIAADGQVAR